MKTKVPSLRVHSLLALLLGGAATAPAQTLMGGGGSGGNSLIVPSMAAAGAVFGAVADQIRAANDARNELTRASLAEKKDDAALRAKAEALGQAELRLALQRADEFARLQGGPNKLTPEQVQSLAALVVTMTGRNLLINTGSAAPAGVRGPGP